MKPVSMKVFVLLASQCLGGYAAAGRPSLHKSANDLSAVHYQEPGQKPISFDDQIKRLKSQSIDERRDAIERLAELADHRAVDPLIGMLADQTADIRAAAIDALGALEEARAVEPIIGSLKGARPIGGCAGCSASHRPLVRFQLERSGRRGDRARNAQRLQSCSRAYTKIEGAISRRACRRRQWAWRPSR